MPDANNQKKHIVFSGRTTPERYTFPGIVVTQFTIQERTPSEHGKQLKDKLTAIQQQISQDEDAVLPQGLIREDVIYIDFLSDVNIKLAFDSFEDGRSGNYHLLSCFEEENHYRALVAVSAKGLTKLITMVEEYSSKLTKSNNPKNQKLVSNISDIRRASLKSFWNEPFLPFPNEDEQIWWEVWLRKEINSNDDVEEQKVVTQLAAIGASVGSRRLVLPEHIIKLVKATPLQLSSSLLLLDNLSELRKAKETAEFFTDLRNSEQAQWVADVIARTQTSDAADQITVCVLDTGVNNSHPLLLPFLPNANMDSVNPAWGNLDSHPHGHGTQMAGLALYGDLVPLLNSQGVIQIFHTLESIKLFNPAVQHDPEVYGAVTNECVSRAVVLNPNKRRIFCLAITSKDNRDQGRPSSWSSAVDKIVFGSDGTSTDKKLLLVSVGNVEHDNPSEYPAKNKTEHVHDPAQSFNTIGVGGVTDKDMIDAVQYPNSSALAIRGGLAPSSSTSCISQKQWPIKPDIVMEAGNYGVQNNSLIYPASLQLLTTNKNFITSQFIDFRDTSAATALASNLVAQIYQQYPSLWPETIRGVIIHSAHWTQQMLGATPLRNRPSTQKRDLLRTYGYGVPDLQRAVNSLSNSVTMIAERTIKPYFKEEGRIKTHHLHLFDLPWPSEVLEGLNGAQVRMTITLSYFIEPNPGNRYFTSKFLYQSHGLRFKVKRPLESLDEFRARVNGEAQSEEDDAVPIAQGDNWQLGERVRNVGSIHKDIWEGTGAELAQMASIAVYPVNGWWKLRTKLKRYENEVRYSLIVNIETAAAGVDLYTPIENLVSIQV